MTKILVLDEVLRVGDCFCDDVLRGCDCLFMTKILVLDEVLRLDDCFNDEDLSVG
jgi:hypothetical protein